MAGHLEKAYQGARFALHDNPLAWVLGIVTAGVGLLMPAFQSGVETQRYINVIWGSVYGLGFALSDGLLGYSALESPFGLFGCIIWPSFIFWLISYFFSKVLNSERRLLLKIIALILFATTFCFNMTIRDAELDRNSWLPVYTKYIDSVP